jgi:hypothetical protein
MLVMWHKVDHLYPTWLFYSEIGYEIVTAPRTIDEFFVEFHHAGKFGDEK